MNNDSSQTINTTLSIYVADTLEELLNNEAMNKEYSSGETYFQEDRCCMLSYSNDLFEIIFSHSLTESEIIQLKVFGDRIINFENQLQSDWNGYAIAALLLLESKITDLKPEYLSAHKKYSREGMIHRVIDERRQKALKEQYRFEFADNIYGDHWVYTDKGKRYKVFLRDFEQETGYSDSLDAQVNKLGTTKHIMAAFNRIKTDKRLFKKLSKELPFIEIYLDPVNDYRISKFSNASFPEELQELLHRFFGSRDYIENDRTKDFLPFLEEAANHEQIVIRPEVFFKIDKAYNRDMLSWLKSQFEIPYDQIKASLYPYQKEAVSFFTFKEGGILADEMGLGKTLQSIAIAVAKKTILGFKKTLIVCPASLKDQWKKEIEKFSNEKAQIVSGSPEARALQYKESTSYFIIANYEAVLRDFVAINKAGVDLLILDEAQRIKNFETKTSTAIKRVHKRHALVLTGTPIENRISDLFSLMQVVDAEFLGPLWEFSYRHCLFDHEKSNKINGYYDLKGLNKFLKPILLRREKRKVIEQLPNVNQLDIIVKLGWQQADYHASYAKGVSQILKKKFITPVDQTRLYQLLAAMRMVCNSTYLIDTETNESTKLIELEHVLLEKLDLLNSPRKIIIFSEWLKSHKLIADILRKHGLSYIEFNGSVPVKHRGVLIKKFEEDPNCKVFLSTESGGAGLNLQVADTLINFELPWNPAKKNQRIGRIDRLGQKNNHLTVLNFITQDSIEMRIAAGLQLKQNLFDGVLNESNELNYVDFSEKGKSQFLDELKSMMTEFETVGDLEEEELSNEKNDLEEYAVVSNLQVEEVSEGEIAEADEKDLSDEKDREVVDGEDEKPMPVSGHQQATEQLEEVLSQGMGFFAGLYKMATGEDMKSEEQTIKVDGDTGEVTMKFKLPGFKK